MQGGPRQRLSARGTVRRMRKHQVVHLRISCRAPNESWRFNLLISSSQSQPAFSFHEGSGGESGKSGQS